MQHLKIRKKFKGFLLRNRWWIYGLLVTSIALFEIHEHPNLPLANPLLVEISLFTILFGVAFFFLELLLRTIAARNKLVQMLKFRDRLILRLSMAQDWDEFCQRMLEFPRSLAKVNHEFLLVYRDQDNRFTLEAAWPAAIEEPARLNEIQHNCRLCIEDSAARTELISTCTRLQSATCPGVHCLKFRYAERVIGILYFCLENDAPLSVEARESLESASIVIAPVLEAFSQKRGRVAAEIADATRAERLAIAQDMHDTIGQNLCYLRLRLDQYSSPGGLRKANAARQELELMRDTANESYELVRGALAVLHLENSPQFVDLLRAQGLLVAERAGFEFILESIGEPRPLAPEVMRHAFYACKEALTNVERHAQAKIVTMQLHWTEAGLDVTVVDDGIGFDYLQTRPSGHFGLDIMKKRIESIQGCLSVSSTPPAGTNVNFWVPYAQKIQPRTELLT